MSAPTSSRPDSPPDPEASVRRLAFLARAGDVLASSLDYAQTLQEVARLALQALGDFCIVDVLEEGVLRRVATAHAVPAKAVLLEELRRRYVPSPDSPQPAARVLRTGEVELLDHVTPEVVSAHTLDRDHARLILAIGIRSHLAIPLVARGITLGALSLGITESDRGYAPEDVALAQDLARRAALAVDNARLYDLAQKELAERRRAEIALRLSESRFRAIMEQSPLSTQILSPQGRTMSVNPAWEALWGLTLEQIAAHNILTDPHLESTGIAPLLRRAFGGEAVELPAFLYDPSVTVPDRSPTPDSARWVRAFAYPIKDAAGVVQEVVLVHEDVTGTRTGQERLRASEERLRMALAAGRMNVWEWDLTTGVVQCSENARGFWGMEVGPAEDFLAVIHPDDRTRVQEAKHDAVMGEGGYLCEYRLTVPAGSVRWMQSRGRVDRAPDGRADRILGVTIDITGLKQAQEVTRLLADAGETLGASLDYHATLQSLTHTVVPRLADWCAVDLLTESGTLARVSVHHPDPGQLASANDLFARFPPRPSDPYGAWHVIGTGQAEWAADVGPDVLEAVAQGPDHLALLRALNIRSYICVPLVARGAAIGVLTLAYSDSGRRYTVADVAIATDLGRRAAAAVDNAQLHQQLRGEDRRKDEFLATLAHELRNPLAPIRTGISLLRLSTDQALADRTLQIMDRQLGHMVRLIDDLLDLSRVTRGKVELERERVDLSSIVGTAIEASRPLLDAAALRLVVRLPGRPVMVEADPTRMSQVFSNLLNNAAKFTGRGGRVDLEVLEDEAGVLVKVTDTGIGIPAAMLQPIFEMFAQASDARGGRHGGLGIGLTLVRRLVELHGGRVWAESDGPDRGSTFVVRLPRASAAAPAAVPGQLSLPAPSPAPRRVLVVDDNADAAETLAALLTLEGHEVRTAGSGPAALRLLADFHPEVAFLDIGLPGMSGYELAQRLRAEKGTAGATLVAVTGWGQNHDRRQAMDAGFDDHLTKPVDSRDVKRLVGQARRAG